MRYLLATAIFLVAICDTFCQAPQPSPKKRVPRDTIIDMYGVTAPCGLSLIGQVTAGLPLEEHKVTELTTEIDGILKSCAKDADVTDSCSPYRKVKKLTACFRRESKKLKKDNPHLSAIREFSSCINKNLKKQAKKPSGIEDLW